MFEKVRTCEVKELLQIAQEFSTDLKTSEEKETFLRILWERVFELSPQQEKELHKVGRKIRKKFLMKPLKF